jgi:tetratricopeptide (TPR) repeat protein
MNLSQKVDEELGLLKECLGKDPVDHIAALTIVSGETAPEIIEGCRKKIHGVVQLLRTDLPDEYMDKVRHIYEFYREGNWAGTDEFVPFPQAVDNFVNPEAEAIGNCWARSAIFYMIAHQLGVNMDLQVTFGWEHVLLATRGETITYVDLNLGIGVDPFLDQISVSFRKFLSIGYLNQQDNYSSPEDKAQMCRAIIALNPAEPEGYSELAAIHLMFGGDTDIAIRMAAYAVNLSNNVPFFRANLALAYKAAGQPDRAKQILETIIEDDPDAKYLPDIRRKIE